MLRAYRPISTHRLSLMWSNYFLCTIVYCYDILRSYSRYQIYFSSNGNKSYFYLTTSADKERENTTPLRPIENSSNEFKYYEAKSIKNIA